MGQPFPNPVTGGNGSLLIAQIQSPNFSVAGQTGWAILQNGDAYFYQVTTSGSVIITGAGGLFIYAGAPGAGNPPIAYSAPPGLAADPFGNTLPATAGGFVTVSGNLYAQLLEVALEFSGPGITGPGIVAGGVNNTPPELNLVSPTSAAYPVQAIVDLIAAAAAGTPLVQVLNAMVEAASGFLGPAAAIEPGSSPAAAETWHTLTLASGWSTVAGQPVPSYRLLPDGNVQMTGAATHAAFSSATPFSAAGAIPAAYRPVTEQFIAGSVPGTDAAIEITTAGTVNAEPGGASLTTCRFNGSYPTGL